MSIQKPPSKQPIPSHSRRVFKGQLFEVYQWEQKLFDGSTKIFEKIKRPATVMVLPVTDEGKIIITEQEQPGEGSFIGLIGGIVDPGEDILEAAKRELLEESGYTAEQFIFWDAVQLINKIEWSVYTFVAKGLKQEKEMNLDAGEKIKPKFVSFDEFVGLTHDERFRDLEIVLKIHRLEINQQLLEEARKLFLA